MGNILISINPFDWNDKIYSSQVADAYLDPVKPESSGHFFQIAARAFRGATDRSQRAKPQSIIISGESGSGKTEATKKCLQLLTHACAKDMDASSLERRPGLNAKLLAANPLLEAFGNAKTVRNDNSSRFGKWTQVSISRGASGIRHAKLLQFLLEKTRVFTRSPLERNFHVFYQLLAHANRTPALSQMLKLDSSEKSPEFHILGSLNAGGNGVLPADLGAFEDVCRSLDVLGISSEVQMEIWRVLGGVLWLGNVRFEPDEDDSERCSLVAEEPLDSAAELLGVDSGALSHALVHHSRVIGGAVIDSPLTSEQANDSVGSTVKELYSWLFKWLVETVNESFVSEDSVGGDSAVAIGVLDIFGFEIFDENSLEQLCINYANERLQKQFTDTTFAQEEALYKEERIDYTPCEYADNIAVLELIHAKPNGILILLDEECRLPKGADEKLSAKVIKAHASSAPGRRAQASSSAFAHGRPGDLLSFVVKHYAGQVEYTMRGWVGKNKSELRENLGKVLAASSVSVVAAASNGGVDPLRPRSGFRSQVGPFLAQLGELMATIDASDAHYIRCVKPNAAREKLRFDSPICLHQLRCSGVFDAIAIRKQGYPFRRSHQEFFDTYRFLVDKETRKNWRRTHAANDYKSLADCLVGNLRREDIRVGMSRVLYKAEDHLFLRSQLMRVKTEAVMKLNRVMRGFVVRANVAKADRALATIGAASKNRDIAALKQAVAEALAVIPPGFYGHRSRVSDAEEVRPLHQQLSMYR